MKSKIFKTGFLVTFISVFALMVQCGGEDECNSMASTYCAKYSICINKQDCSDEKIYEIVDTLEKAGFANEEDCKNANESLTPMDCTEFISMVGNCTNECQSGAKQCSGNGYQTCGNYDSDSCTEWGSVINCSSGKVCSGGSCITQTPTFYSTITLGIRDLCYDGYRIDFRYFDETNNLVWPSSTENYYTSYDNTLYTNNLTCITGAQICYGGETGASYWGVGLNDEHTCTSCCVTCSDDGWHNWDLTC